MPVLSNSSMNAQEKRALIWTFSVNHEGAIVDRIQQAYFDKADGIIINPAGYTHTSVAILDDLKAAGIFPRGSAYTKVLRKGELPSDQLRVEGGDQTHRRSRTLRIYRRNRLSRRNVE